MRKNLEDEKNTLKLLDTMISSSIVGMGLSDPDLLDYWRNLLPQLFPKIKEAINNKSTNEEFREELVRLVSSLAAFMIKIGELDEKLKSLQKDTLWS